MKKLFLFAVFGALCTFIAQASWAMHHEVKVAEKAGTGKYLTDTEGRTLYWFKKDSPDRSACTGGCVDNWPIYYQEKVAPPAGLAADEFGTITREDGAMQSTFRGYPLYYFKADTKPGEIKGHGLKDVWFVIDPDNFPR